VAPAAADVEEQTEYPGSTSRRTVFAVIPEQSQKDRARTATGRFDVVAVPWTATAAMQTP
jgi:hypothetical protein